RRDGDARGPHATAAHHVELAVDATARDHFHARLVEREVGGDVRALRARLGVGERRAGELAAEIVRPLETRWRDLTQVHDVWRILRAQGACTIGMKWILSSDSAT